jgi:hypothetical protein
LAFGCSCGEKDMKRVDIIALVQEVIIANPNPNPFDFRLTSLEQIKHFVELVSKALRARSES